MSEALGKVLKGIANPQMAKKHIISRLQDYRWMKAKSDPPLFADSLGFNIQLSTEDDGVSKSLYFDKIYAPNETSFYRQFINDGMSVADVGGNIGYFTLLFADLTKSGIVYSFEPEPHNFTLLRRNVENNDISNVKIEQKAISTKGEELNLYKHPTNAGGHSIHKDGVLPFQEFPDDGDVEKVRSVPFDEYFSDKEVPELVKIDVEGGEPDVLFGMEKSLHSIPALSIEYTPHMWSTDPEDVFDFLESYGYEFYEIEDGGDITSVTAAEMLDFDDWWYDILALDSNIELDVR